jgi:1-acyl-sn-glycerol-3-phosphate acyltransferase
MNELNYIVRSLIFYAIYALSVVLIGIMAATVAPMVSEKKAYAYVSRLNYFVIWWLKVSCNVRFEVKGRENIPDTPCVVVSNHQSAWETYFMGTLFQPQSPVLKSELLMIPFFGWALRQVDPIPIDRAKPAAALKQLLVQGKQRLAKGRWVVIFPEGTRVRPGKTAPFSKGGIVLAKQAGVPVLPIVHNAGDCWPAGTFIKRPGLIVVEIGPSLDSDSLTRDQLADQTETWIRSRIRMENVNRPLA